MARGARGPSVLLVVAALAARSAPARATLAPAPHARLDYVVDSTEASCPSAEQFRAAVSSRAGHELFGEPADLTVSVTLQREGDAFVAIVALPDAPGESGVTRELRSESSCAELARAAALVASLVIDPASVLRPPAVAAPPAPAPVEVASRTWRGRLGVGPRAVSGLTSGTTFGLAVSAEADAARASLGVELRGLLPRETTYDAGRVSVLPATLTVLPCGLGRHWEACGAAELGLLRGAGVGFAQDFTSWRVFSALGARGAWAFDAGPARLRASLEGDVALVRTAFRVGDTAAFTTQSVSVTLGLDALFSFW